MMPIDNYELLKVGERKKLSALGSAIATMMTLILNYDKTKEANHPKSFCVEWKKLIKATHLTKNTTNW